MVTLFLEEAGASKLLEEFIKLFVTVTEVRSLTSCTNKFINKRHFIGFYENRCKCNKQ